jgi:hypothetical protein
VFHAREGSILWRHLILQIKEAFFINAPCAGIMAYAGQGYMKIYFGFSIAIKTGALN